MQPMRPRFREHLALEIPDVLERLQTHGAGEGPCSLQVVGRHVTVDIKPELRHFWSPQLTLQLEAPEEGSGGTEVHGLYGPSPNVWTTFLAIYAFLTLSTFFATIFGLAQQVARETPWGLGALPLGALGVALTYLASLFGQRLAAEQMTDLVRFFHAALDLPHPADAPA